MFERYTEKARRVIFFSRYEASQVGSPYIETEHLLLGLLREDVGLTRKLGLNDYESIRKDIDANTMKLAATSTATDLPLSNECKRVLAYAAEEAERLGDKHIGTEHLLLGLLREKKCFAAELMVARGLKLEKAREQIGAGAAHVEVPKHREDALLAAYSRDLTEEAMNHKFDPMVGREEELARVIEVLGRRNKNNPLLIGEAGVGKTAIGQGLAMKIADGDVPEFLREVRVRQLEVSAVIAGADNRRELERRLWTIMTELRAEADCIVFIDGLQSMLGTAGPGGMRDAASILKPAFSRDEARFIVTATPAQYQKALENYPWLERDFWPVQVAPMSEADTLQLLAAVKHRYEHFHGVDYSDDALKIAVECSARYIPNRYLPDKAVDVIDEAGARVKLRAQVLPDEVVEVQKRIGFIVLRLEAAIANHEFEKARFYSDEEKKEREKLKEVRARHNLGGPATPTVTREEVEEVIARWTGLAVSLIRKSGETPGENSATS